MDLSNYSLSLLRIYDGVEKEVERIINDLDYYFLEETDKSKMMFVNVYSDTDIYIITKINKYWNNDKLQLIVSNALKNSTYMISSFNTYFGSMEKDFWNEINSCHEFFENPNKFRENYEIDIYDDTNKPSIDDILTKISKEGIDSLSDKEKRILKNNNR